jgi:hypothetical protein
MAHLEQQITRDLSLHENKDGYWYFTITEAGREVMESDLFQTSMEASAAGMKWLDILHDEHPLRNNDRPAGE